MNTTLETRRSVELEGALGTLTVEEIVGNIGSKNQTGVLTVNEGNKSVSVFFEHGKVIGTASHLDSDKVGNTLVQLGNLTRMELESLLVRGGDRGVVIPLLETERLGPDDWSRCARVCLEEDALTLFRFRNGEFRFETGETGFADILKFPMEVGDFVNLGTELASGWDQVEEHIPSTDWIPRVRPIERRQFTDMKLSEEDWSVLSVINGRGSVEYVINRAGIGRIATIQALARLDEKGLIELCESDSISDLPAVESLDSKQTPRDTVELLASFVNRLLEKFRSKAKEGMDDPWLSETWRQLLARYPLADSLELGAGGVSVRRYQALVGKFSNPTAAKATRSETELALCRLSDRVFEKAEGICGSRWTGNAYNQVYKKVLDVTYDGISPDDLNRLPIQRKGS